MKAVIELEHVTKVFRKEKVVDDLSFRIEEGSVVALLGPNGAGKTTTVSMMLGLLSPTSGSVRLLGSDPKERRVKEKIGVMLQEASVIDGLKVSEIIDLFRHYYPRPLPLEQLLKISGLEEVRNKMATSLSGGQKRRLGFALAMAGDPSILFLDEPTVGMDLTSRKAFWETMRGLAGSGRTIILTTHYLEEAESIADRIIVINKGKKIADGPPDEIKATNRKYVSFVAGPSVTREELSALPGIIDLHWSGRKVQITTTNSDQLIFAIAEKKLDVKDIEIHSGGLNEAFESLLDVS